MRFSALAVVFVGIILSLLAGCGAGRTVSVRDGDRLEKVTISASNFDFEPTVIKASSGETLTLVIENVSGTDHNFTIKNPAGEIIHDVELPEKSTREVQLLLAERGVYPFHCDKPFHSTLGMEGKIEVQ